MSERTFAHRPALDGIRAIAVVAVLLYHMGVPGVPGGFLGVDAFFVLSGYLITSLLLLEWRDHGRIDLRAFYARRARRLLPALFTVTLAIAAWALVFGDPTKLRALRGDGLSSLVYLTNWRFIVVGESYFDHFGDPSPFRHMWSLAIEEQFYLFYPLLLIGLLRLARGRRSVLALGLTVVALVSIAMMAVLYLMSDDPSRAYFGTDARLHELMIGSLLRVLVLRGSPAAHQRTVASWAGVPLLVALGCVGAVTMDTAGWLYHGGFAVICLLVAALITSLEWAPAGPAARLLSVRPVVWIGTISYGLYLWHWPVVVAVSEERTGLSGAPLLGARVVLSVGLAALCYHLVEAPLRRRINPVGGTVRRRWTLRFTGRRWPLAPTMSLAALLTALSIAAATAAGPLVDSSDSTSIRTVRAPTVSAPDTTVLLIGDSVPYGLTRQPPTALYPWMAVKAGTTLGCALLRVQHAEGKVLIPTPSACRTGPSLTAAQVQVADPDVALIFLGIGELSDVKVGSQVFPLGSSKHAEWLSAQLDTTVDLLRPRGVPVALVDVGCYRVPGLNTAETRVFNDARRVTTLNHEIAAYAASRQLRVIDLHAAICANGYTSSLPGVGKLRVDGVHFSPAGAAHVWGVLAPTIRDLRAPKD